MVDTDHSLACRSRKLDGLATIIRAALREWKTSDFFRETKLEWAGSRETISAPVEAEVFS